MKNTWMKQSNHEVNLVGVASRVCHDHQRCLMKYNDPSCLLHFTSASTSPQHNSEAWNLMDKLLFHIQFVRQFLSLSDGTRIYARCIGFGSYDMMSVYIYSEFHIENLAFVVENVWINVHPCNIIENGQFELKRVRWVNFQLHSHRSPCLFSAKEFPENLSEF